MFFQVKTWDSLQSKIPLRFKSSKTLPGSLNHWEWPEHLAMFFHFNPWDSIQSRIPLRFNQSQTLKKKKEKISCARSECTLAKILSILSVELLRYGIISFISSKMLHYPPEIKFCAFYKVSNKFFLKLLHIKKDVLIAD